MKFAPALRSTTVVTSLLIAAAASCTNGVATTDQGNPGGGSGGAPVANGGAPVANGGAPVTSGGGAPGNPDCPGAAAYSISDLEQPSQYALWSTSHDATAGGVQNPMGAFTASQLPDGHYAVHTSGTGFTTWGAGVAVNTSAAKKCLDFSKFTGIKFRAKGPANLTIAAQVPGVVPVASGGTCADNCYDSHKTSISVGADFAEYTLYWSQFQQAGWGTPAAFSGSAVTLIDFEVGAGDMPFDFWIDDVAFTDQPPPTTGAGGATGAGGTTGGAGAPPSGGSGGAIVVPSHQFSDVLTEAQFNQMFPNRNGFYTYAGLAAAAAKFPLFAAIGDAATQKREVAAFLGNVARETGNLKFIDELSPQSNYCQSGNAQYPCAAGQDYHGRGPMQISWNYNYGAAGAALGANLLANPGLVSSDATVSWETAIWFWMTVMAGGRTAHTVMVQNAGFGLTINVINGNIECNGGNSEAVNQRVNAYKSFCALLGVDPGANLTC